MRGKFPRPTHPISFVDPDGTKYLPLNPILTGRTVVEGTATPTNWAMSPLSLVVNNCHSQAWHNGGVDKNEFRAGITRPFRWGAQPVEDMKRATKLDPNAPNRVGDVVVYGFDKNKNGVLDPNEVLHSAKVVSVDSQGNTLLVESKEGTGNIVLHHPTAQQPSYGNLMGWYRPAP